MKYAFFSTWAGKQQGFTLIELLLAFGILSILTAFVTTSSFSILRHRRDLQRKHDIKQIYAALEAYRFDAQRYPGVLTVGNSCGTQASVLSDSTTATVYMAKVPCDPGTGQGYLYNTTPGSFVGQGAAYCLRACLENVEDVERDAVRPGAPVTNPLCTALVCPAGTVSYSVAN